MLRIFLLATLFFLALPANAYKVFSYDSDGNRIYRTVEPKDYVRYKNAPRRSYIRTPRTSWEITETMRMRKRTSSQMTHRS